MPRLHRYRAFLVFAVLAIIAFYRFTGLRNSDDSSVVGVPSLKNHGFKGQDSTAPLRIPDILKEANPPVVDLTHVKDTRPTETAPPVVSIEKPSQTIHTTSQTLTKPSQSTASPEPFPNVADEVIGNSGQGRVQADPLPPDLPVIHWVKQPEDFPVPSGSTIQLPGGTPKPIPRIQHVFDKEESEAERAARLEKLAVIKSAFLTSWQAYKDFAWTHDEVKPTSGQYKDPFCGWGATLVDTLDTLWMMGLKEEFEEAVKAVAVIDFTTSPRDDIPLFETVIRYLGGLLGAYDVSGAKYRILLDKAVELAEVLMGAFDTLNRMPETYYLWKPAFASQPHRAKTRVVLAELGSLSLEFTRLAQLTMEPKYYDAIARITDAFDEWQMHTKLPGLWPLSVDASGCAQPSRIFKSSGQSSQLEGPQTIPGPGSGLQSEPEALARGLSDGDMPNVGPIEAPITTQPMPGYDGRGQNRDEGARVKRELNEHVPLNITAGINSSIAGRMTPATKLDGDCIHQGLASPLKTGVEEFSVGSQADSTYEYLSKEYLLLGGLMEQYRTMYTRAGEAITRHLIFRPMTIDNADILFAGIFSTNGVKGETAFEKLSPRMGHLTCFLGGMYALGSRLFDRPTDLDLAKKLTEGCIWAYNSTVTRIMPEDFQVVPCENITECTWNETKWFDALDPSQATRTKSYSSVRGGTLPQLVPLNPAGKLVEQVAKMPVSSESVETAAPSTLIQAETAITYSPVSSSVHDKIKRQLVDHSQIDSAAGTAKSINASHVYSHSSGASTEHATKASPSLAPSKIDIYTPPPPPSHEEYVKARIEDERLPPGFTWILDKRYILRPEAIESIYYMYRITGSAHWRDAGWRMFQAIEAATRTTHGYSAIKDVTARAPIHTDSMESFWLAETLKYFFLLFSEEEECSLDDWVLNTEAHPFKIPK